MPAPSKLLRLATLAALSSLAACASGPEVSTSLPLGLATVAPDGYRAMCQRDLRECPQWQAAAGTETNALPAAFATQEPRAALGLTPALWDQLNSVNIGINRHVRYESDKEAWNQDEFWAPAVTAGDCEDFALAKRDALRAAGLPDNALSLALVQSARTGAHAVLVANTDKGSYVLDSSISWILPWNKTDYTWITAQDGSGQWRVAGNNAQAVLLALLALLASKQQTAGAGNQVSVGSQKPYVVAAETGGR